MRVCIVTVHDSINSGSFWQARALGSTLEKLGHQAVYLRRSAYDHTGNLKKSKLKNLAGSFIYQGFGAGILNLRKLMNFRKILRQMPEIGLSASETERIDCFILGSDTIWNFNSNYFRANRDIFLGKPFLAKKVFPYAASAANTSADCFREIDAIEETIRRWQAVSVRDEHTREILSSLTDREISVVCDPTLLLDKKDYAAMAGDVPEKNYIFLYLFQPLAEKHARELAAFAKEKGLKIICGSMGDMGVACDKTIVNSPYAFLSYMLHADYVITDTFHGTIFSTNLEKRYAAVNRGKLKVNQFLAQLQLSDRLAEEGGSLTEILSRETDYERVRAGIAQMRSESLDFLKNALEA